ncbi:MAG: hypothetical protein EXR58_08740 [Chloroflexi bacterium]|nr:hypothetical protein [Chloroflexota bacterium]
MALRAAAAGARGAILLAEGDSAGALQAFHQSVQLWREAEAPYEAAMARAGLARAFHAMGDSDSSAMELRVARAALSQLGAALDLVTLI